MLSVFKKSLWTRELIAWYLYDFANSFISINMIVYFSQWIVVDRGLSDFWFSVPIILSTILLVFISTHVGAIGDRKGSHFRILALNAILTIVALVAIIVSGRTLSAGYVFIPLILFGFYQLFYQLALVPYSAFIKHISKQKEYGKVSGIGFALSNIGNILGLVLTLPIIQGSITLFGSDRLAPLIPGVIAFFLLFIPTYLVFRKKKFPVGDKEETKVPFFKSFWNNLKYSRKYPGVFPLLLSFYLFSDAITTLSIYSAIYLQKVFAISDSFKVTIFIIILAGFVVGAFSGGVLSDRYSHRKILIVSLFIEALSIFIIALNRDTTLLTPTFALFGLAMGLCYTSSRSYLVSLIPVKESGLFFGLYTFAERFASVVGPAIWGITILIFSSLAPANYRAAAFIMGILVLAGVIPLMRLSVQKSKVVLKKK